MSTAILAVALAFTSAQTPKDDSRPPHPFAPSLLQLDLKEQKKVEEIVERFIQFDIGKLPGPAGKKAAEDFDRLPAEAVFVLIDGFNRTANMEASCPCVVIGKKIIRIINASKDLELMTFARENLGAGVTAKRHQGMLKDVQFAVLLRKGAIQREMALTGTSAKPIASMNAPELAKHMAKQQPLQLKDLLRHEKPAVKAAAAKEIGARGLPLYDELLMLLESTEATVVQAARAALRQLSGQDFGPEPEASLNEREAAVRRWREWLTKRP